MTFWEESGNDVNAFVARYLSRVPIYRILATYGVTIRDLNCLHAEGIETAYDLRDRQSIYGLTGTEMSRVTNWYAAMEAEALEQCGKTIPLVSTPIPPLQHAGWWREHAAVLQENPAMPLSKYVANLYDTY